MARAKRQRHDDAADPAPAAMQPQPSPSMIPSPSPAPPPSWQTQAEAMRAALPDACRAMGEARTRMAPRLSSVFASADEASAALLETDAQRAAFICLAEANACPGTGVAFTAEQLAERIGGSANARQSLVGVCGSLVGRHGCLFCADDEGRISLAVDIPAVAYMTGHSMRPGRTVRLRQGRLLVAVQALLRRDLRSPLSVPAVAAWLRKRVPPLEELSDEAVWVVLAGLQALPYPKEFRRRASLGAAMLSAPASDRAASEHVARGSPVAVRCAPVAGDAPAAVDDGAAATADGLLDVPAAQELEEAAADTAPNSPPTVVSSEPACGQHVWGCPGAGEMVPQAVAAAAPVVSAAEADAAVILIAPMTAKHMSPRHGHGADHRAATPTPAWAAVDDAQTADDCGATGRAPGTRANRQGCTGKPYFLPF